MVRDGVIVERVHFVIQNLNAFLWNAYMSRYDI